MKIQYTGRNLNGVIFQKTFTIVEIEQNEVFQWMKKNNIVPSSIKRSLGEISGVEVGENSF